MSSITQLIDIGVSQTKLLTWFGQSCVVSKGCKFAKRVKLFVTLWHGQLYSPPLLHAATPRVYGWRAAAARRGVFYVELRTGRNYSELQFFSAKPALVLFLGMTYGRKRERERERVTRLKLSILSVGRARALEFSAL